MANKREDDGLDSWEDLVAETIAPQPKVQTQSAHRPKAAKRGGKDTMVSDADCDGDDPTAERNRRERLVQLEQKRITRELFEGCTTNSCHEDEDDLFDSLNKPKSKKESNAPSKKTEGDWFDKFAITGTKDAEDLAFKLAEKIRASPAKSGAWLRFLDIIMQECTLKMEVMNMQTIANKLKSSIAYKQKAQLSVSMNKRKPNDTAAVIRNYEDELNLFYGDDSQNEEDEEEVVKSKAHVEVDDYYKDFM